MLKVAVSVYFFMFIILMGPLATNVKIAQENTSVVITGFI